MNSVDWKKVGIVAALAAGAVGAILGNMLAPEQADQVVAWAEAGKGALLTVAGVVTTFVAALIGARRAGK